MLLKTLVPGFACVISSGFQNDQEDSLNSAIQAGFKKIYIIQGDEVLLHQDVGPGEGGQHCFVRCKVPAIPGSQAIKKYTPSLNFLPAGKIPVELLLSVRDFFREVNVKFKTKLEAMAWIVWSQERGYHLLVPPQRVAAASATYDWSCVPVGTRIIVDIHSHQDMDAFFSGTDDNDDRSGVRYSGVIGRISSPSPRMVFRFNMLGGKSEVKIEDLFEYPLPEALPVDPDWLAQITTHNYTSYPATTQYSGAIGGGQGAHPFRGSTHLDGSPRLGGRAGKAYEFPGDDGEGDRWAIPGGSSGFGRVRGVVDERDASEGLAGAVARGEKAPNLRRVPKDPKEGGLPVGDLEGTAEATPAVYEIHGASFVEVNGVMLPLDSWLASAARRQEREEDAEVEARVQAAAASSHDALSDFCEGGSPVQALLSSQQRAEQEELLSGQWEQEDLLGGQGDRVEEEDEGLPLPGMTLEDLSADPRFGALVAEYGPEAAAAYIMVDEASAYLANTGDLLGRTVDTLFQMVEEGDQLKLFRSLADSLSREDRRRLSEMGL